VGALQPKFLRARELIALLVVLTSAVVVGTTSAIAGQSRTDTSTVKPDASASSARSKDEQNPPSALAAAEPQPKQPSKQGANKVPFVLGATYLGEVAGNTTGGLRRDTTYVGRLLLRSDVDLDSLFSVSGGILRIWFTHRQGNNLADVALGTSTGIQEIYSPQSSHLSVLTYVQRLLDERLEIEAGRTPANLNFLFFPELCAYFQTNSACGSPTFVFKNSNFTFFPPSTWGARVKGWVKDRMYVHMGVYEVNPDRLSASATGLEWSIKAATGVVVPFELGYTTSRNVLKPGTYQVGGWYDTSDYEDPVEDDFGGVAIRSGFPYAARHGRSGAYVSVDQVVWRAANPDRSLRVFGLMMTNLSGRVNEDRYLQFGLVHTGAFRSRRKDSLAFLINDQKFSQLALRNIREARGSVGDTGEVPHHQIMMELAYTMPVSTHFRLSPNVHFIVNPDQLTDPFRTLSVDNILAVGLKFTVDVPIVKPRTNQPERGR
jgi:porin